MKLELILRLLDNDELSRDREQVNDVKDFLDDYVERNQEDFDEFSDVDELYNSLPLDKVESLEDLVTIGPPGLVKMGRRIQIQRLDGFLPGLIIKGKNVLINGDAADIQDVFKLLKEDGVFDETKVPFSSTNVTYGETVENTIVKNFKSNPHNRRLMDRLINSLDQDGPFVAEYMMFDHYGDTEMLNQYYKEKGKWKLGEVWQPTDSKGVESPPISRCVLVNGYETSGWCDDANRMLGHWTYVNREGPTWVTEEMERAKSISMPLEPYYSSRFPLNIFGRVRVKVGKEKETYNF
ncbi:hypothetical protein OROMI_024292 [Orobanche minor]